MHSQFDWDDFWHWRKKLRAKLRLEEELNRTADLEKRQALLDEMKIIEILKWKDYKTYYKKRKNKSTGG